MTAHSCVMVAVQRDQGVPVGGKKRYACRHTHKPRKYGLVCHTTDFQTSVYVHLRLEEGGVTRPPCICILCHMTSLVRVQWMECNAKFVNTTSGRAVPYGFNCNVEKRCTCLSCTKGSGVADEGAPCSCSDIPDSVQGKAAARCAQT